MRYLILLLLTACSLQTPISQFDPQVKAICDRTDNIGSYDGQEFMWFEVDDMDAMYTYCGETSDGRHKLACTHVERGVIYVRDGLCEHDMAHELNHLVGNDWVDRPDVPPMPFER